MFEKEITKLLNCPKIPWTKESLKTIPQVNGVYVLSRKDKFLYVGQSRNLYDRIVNHHWTRNNSSMLKNLEIFHYKTLKESLSLDEFIKDCYIQFVEVKLGRAELEDYIISKVDPILNNFGYKVRSL